MKNFSKRMTTLLSKVEERSYSPIEAIKLVKENANAKFDETIEAHIRQVLTQNILINNSGRQLPYQVVLARKYE